MSGPGQRASISPGNAVPSGSPICGQILISRGELTMTSIRGRFLQRLRSLLPNQRGITGLETAIVLIAFVVVSSVFAFAALSIGLCWQPAKVGHFC